jgi:hypothetical protein
MGKVRPDDPVGLSCHNQVHGLFGVRLRQETLPEDEILDNFRP